jgi:hypothetical protein
MDQLLADGQARPGGLALVLGCGASSSFAGQVVRLPRPAESDQGRRQPVTPSPHEVLRRVTEAVRALSPPGSSGIGRETSFFSDLGGGQLLIAEVLAEVEPGLGAHLPHQALLEIRTVGDLVDRLQGQVDTARRQQ